MKKPLVFVSLFFSMFPMLTHAEIITQKIKIDLSSKEDIETSEGWHPDFLAKVKKLCVQRGLENLQELVREGNGDIFAICTGDSLRLENRKSEFSCTQSLSSALVGYEDLERDLRAIVEEANLEFSLEGLMTLSPYRVGRLIEKHVFDADEAKRLSYDLRLHHHEQGLLTKKIAAFLKKELPPVHHPDFEARKKLMEDFEKSEGECAGLSTLWVYGKKLSDGSPEEPGKPRDDVERFNHLRRKLALWDGVAEFTPEEKHGIERFISNIILYQKRGSEVIRGWRVDQFDILNTLEDTKRGKPVISYDRRNLKAFVLNEQTLNEKLKDVVRPGTMLILSASQHATAAYQSISDGAIYFYDPNSSQGDKKVADVSALTKEFWEATDPAKFEKGFSRQTAMGNELKRVEVLGFHFRGDPAHEYSTQEGPQLSTEEFLNLFRKSPWMVNFRFSKNVISPLTGEKASIFESLVQSLTDQQILELLTDANLVGIPDEIRTPLKDLLVKYAASDLFGRSPLVARVLLQQEDSLKRLMRAHPPQITTEQYFEIVRHAETRLKHPRAESDGLLTLSEVLQVLSERPGDQELATRLLGGKWLQDRNNQDALKYLNEAVKNNLRSGSIETAKLILEATMGPRAGLRPDFDSILEYNPEIIRFLYDKFPDEGFYPGKFTHEQFPFVLPEKIKRLIHGYEFDPALVAQARTLIQEGKIQPGQLFRTREGFTTLHRAARGPGFGLELARLYVTENAFSPEQVAALDARSSSALESATYWGNKELIELLAPRTTLDDLIRSLQEAESQWYHRKHHDRSIIDFLKTEIKNRVRTGKLSTSEILSIREDRKNLLHWAAKKGYLDLVEVFVRDGHLTPEQVNLKDDYGASALMIGETRRNTPLVEFLLREGHLSSQQIAERDSSGQSALMGSAFRAYEKEDLAITKLLVEKTTLEDLQASLIQAEREAADREIRKQIRAVIRAEISKRESK